MSENNKEVGEARVKKVVNRKGQITKHATAGIAGKKVVNGKVEVISGSQKRAQRLGTIKRRKTLKMKSKAKIRRSALFGAAGRRKRAAMGVHDTRNG